jgi:hypothetical protein
MEKVCGSLLVLTDYCRSMMMKANEQKNGIWLGGS